MIKGTTVGLRAIELEDLSMLKEWRNIDFFRRNFREVRELNQANQLLWFDRLNKSSNDYMFMITRLEDNKSLGACGLLYINWINRSADYSFYIGESDFYIDNIGYAYEATKLLLMYGFERLNLNKIWMELYEFDIKKIDFFTEKFKFKIDGCLRENCYTDGKFWNSYIISLTLNDYMISK